MKSFLKLAVSGIFFLLIFTSFKEVRDGNYRARKATLAPKIDGLENDACWANAEWAPMDHVWLGDSVSPNDFQGRYKVSWTKEKIYVLVEIVDDTLIDIHKDGLDHYWDDDCVEIFIDENRSGGDHQYNHNAFAYHIGLDYKVVDIGPDKKPHYYKHAIAKRTKKGKTYLWEIGIDIYDDTFDDNSAVNKPKELNLDKQMGFAIAYCDNDHSEKRENFIGSIEIKGEDKDRGWIDAGVFGILDLSEK